MECLEYLLAKAAGSACTWFWEARHVGNYVMVPMPDYAGWQYLVGSPAPDGDKVELHLFASSHADNGREHIEEGVATRSVSLTSDGHLSVACLDPCDNCDFNLHAIGIGLYYAPGGLSDYEDRMSKKRYLHTW